MAGKGFLWEPRRDSLEAKTREHTLGLPKGKGKDLSTGRTLNVGICFGRIRTISPGPWRNMPTASWHWYVYPGTWDDCIFSAPMALLTFLLPSPGEECPWGGYAPGSAAYRSSTHRHTSKRMLTWHSPLTVPAFSGGSLSWEEICLLLEPSAGAESCSPQ